MRKPTPHEQADAFLVRTLDTAAEVFKTWPEDKRKEPGAILKLVLLVLHQTEVVLQYLRPDLREPFLDMVEAFLIETQTSKDHSATELREKALAYSAIGMHSIENMDMSQVDEKPKA